jgi:pimeloyl-ACP methyl ester carboxylesterase
MKRVLRVFGVVVILVGVGAAVVYLRPLWVQMQVTHLGLFADRVQSNYVAMPEGRVHYYEAEAGVPGGGIPLVLVHGLGDRGESWAPQLVRLRDAGFHVYAPDLLGAGRSPHPADGDYTLGHEEQFVVEFLHALGLQRVDIGGWSMGGGIVLKLALDHPELIDRVVVYDGVGVRFARTYGNDIFQLTTPAAISRLGALMEPGGKPLPAFILRDAVRVFGQQQWIVDKQMADMETEKDALDDRLGGLTEPLLIVWGAKDQLIPVAAGETMHRLDPRSELDVIDGCGHLAPKSCPVPVAQATIQFLKAEPAPAGGERRLQR